MQISTIVILTDSVRNNGGAAKVAIKSAIGLSQLRYRVIFVGGEGGPVDEQLEASEVEVISLDQPSISDPASRRKSFITGLWNLDAARRLQEILAQLDPSVSIVHLHSWSKVLSTSIIPVIRKSRMRLVLTLHDYFTACPNGGFYDYKTNQICHRLPLSAACLSCNCDARNITHKMWRVARQAIQRGPGEFPASVDAFIAVSDYSERILKPFLPKETPLHRVDNPVECIKLPASDPAKSSSVLYIGRLSPEKGPALLAAAARKAGVQVTFAGDGELKDSLQATYPEHTFTGWLSFGAILPLINSARAIVLPSLWYETLGLTVLECAARGVPAIIADSSAATDVVLNEETGLFFTGGDQTSLTQALQRLSDGDLVARLGLAAYNKFWKEPPTLENHVNNLVAVYDKVTRLHAPFPQNQQ